MTSYDFVPDFDDDSTPERPLPPNSLLGAKINARLDQLLTVAAAQAEDRQRKEIDTSRIIELENTPLMDFAFDGVDQLRINALGDYSGQAPCQAISVTFLSNGEPFGFDEDQPDDARQSVEYDIVALDGEIPPFVVRDEVDIIDPIIRAEYFEAIRGGEAQPLRFLDRSATAQIISLLDDPRLEDHILIDHITVDPAED